MLNWSGRLLLSFSRFSNSDAIADETFKVIADEEVNECNGERFSYRPSKWMYHIAPATASPYNVRASKCMLSVAYHKGHYTLLLYVSFEPDVHIWLGFVFYGILWFWREMNRVFGVLRTSYGYLRRLKG